MYTILDYFYLLVTNLGLSIVASLRNRPPLSKETSSKLQRAFSEQEEDDVLGFRLRDSIFMLHHCTRLETTLGAREFREFKCGNEMNNALSLCSYVCKFGGQNLVELSGPILCKAVT